MFADFRGLGNEVIKLIDPSDSLVLVAGFKAIISSWFVIYIMYTGYLTIAGKTTEPLKDIIWKLIMFSIISMFAFNIGGWFTTVETVINGLNSWASDGGAITIYNKLDVALLKVDNLHKVFIKSDPSYFKLQADIGISIVYVSFYIFSAFVTILLMLNSLVLQVSIYVFPFAVVALTFSWFKGVFERWLELALANLFNILFISLFFNAIWDNFSLKFDSLLSGATDVPIFTTAFGLAGLSFIAFFLIRLATTLSDSLTRVSINSLPGSAINQTAKGLASKSAGMAYVGSKFAQGGRAIIAGKDGGGANGKPVGGLIGVANEAGRSVRKGYTNAHSLYKQGQQNRSNANKQGGIPSKRGGSPTYPNGRPNGGVVSNPATSKSNVLAKRRTGGISTPKPK